MAKQRSAIYLVCIFIGSIYFIKLNPKFLVTLLVLEVAITVLPGMTLFE